MKTNNNQNTNVTETTESKKRKDAKHCMRLLGAIALSIITTWVAYAIAYVIWTHI